MHTTWQRVIDGGREPNQALSPQLSIQKVPQAADFARAFDSQECHRISAHLIAIALHRIVIVSHLPKYHGGVPPWELVDTPLTT